MKVELNESGYNIWVWRKPTYTELLLNLPALGVSVKSVHLVAGRLGFSSQSGHTKDFKNSIRSFRARRSAQAEVRRVLCMCCSSCYVP